MMVVSRPRLWYEVGSECVLYLFVDMVQAHQRSGNRHTLDKEFVNPSPCANGLFFIQAWHASLDESPKR